MPDGGRRARRQPGSIQLNRHAVTPSSRRAVVVGAGSGNGIGRESALALAATGADVVCADRDLPAAGRPPGSEVASRHTSWTSGAVGGRIARAGRRGCLDARNVEMTNWKHPPMTFFPP